MKTEERDAVSRRGFIRAATGAAAATAAAGQAAAQDGGTETASGNESTGTSGGNESTEGGGGGGGGGGTEEVTVGPGGDLTFEPSELEIQPGTTVKWSWDSDNHNVVPDSTPDGADWSGTGDPSKTFDTGHEYSHTFDTEGEYSYFCQPHKSAGMTGSVNVSKDAGGGGGGGGGPPPVPDSARTLGIASLIGMASTLGLAFFFLKYGGDYEVDE